MKSISEISIKPLSSELTQDYLDFFDNRAFTDDNPNGPCYCTSPNQDEKMIKKMVSEFSINGIKETLRKYAVNMLKNNEIHGYLAFDNNVVIGWCNAADMRSYSGFIPDFAYDCSCGKTISIVCLEIAPEYRKMGIASALINRVCSDAKEKGYASVEGYPIFTDMHNDFVYQGPIKLYEKLGFEEVVRQGHQMVMRRFLNV